MILPVVFATIVWYLAAKFRRQTLGFLVVLLAIAALVLLMRPAIEPDARGAARVVAPMPEWWKLGSKQVLVLLIPYAALVGSVGLFIACLPRPKEHWQCGKCRYDLRGLSVEIVYCPECGRRLGHHPAEIKPPVEMIPIPKGPAKRRVNL